ncbi:MAG: hypothetical protein R3E73_10120 [Porticoccaceae bacterium]
MLRKLIGKPLNEADHHKIFVGGQWITPSSSDQRSPLSVPQHEEVIGSVPKCAQIWIPPLPPHLDAHEELHWRVALTAGRAAHILRFADAIEKRGKQLAESVSLQNGMPINVADTLQMSEFVVGVLRCYTPH